jgi:D-sedoheptulose 7-phosphate isomerase
MNEIILTALKEGHAALEMLMKNNEVIKNIELAAELMIEAFKKGGKVYSAGNGGSMCDAMHFAEELSGKFRNERVALGAMAISDPSHLSCVANDYGYEYVFSRFLEGMGREDDIFLGISTSGSSKNIIRGVEMAKDKGLKTIVMTGKPGCSLGEIADIHICTPGGTKYSDRVQELHIKCIHIMIELIERGLLQIS